LYYSAVILKMSRTPCMSYTTTFIRFRAHASLELNESFLWRFLWRMQNTIY